MKSIPELVIDDVGGAFTVGMAYLGDKLGLFTALASLGRASSATLAARTGLDERYVREWLKAMVASRYVEYEPEAKAYFMTPEQKSALADESARNFVGGVFQFTLPSLLLAPQLLEAFRRGGGISYESLPPEVPAAIDRMHRPWFDHELVQQWLPAAPGLVERMTSGISVLDVGCGLGRSTVAMSRAYPRSTFLGIEPHQPSLERAEQLARQSGATNAQFAPRCVEALETEPARFDLVLAIDCVHDMVDPTRSLRAMKAVLSNGGVVFWSEPTGSREPQENRTPAGKMRANLSPFHCLTVSLAGGGAGLGTIIGEAGARDLASAAGFTRFEKLPIDNPMQQFFLLRP